MMAANIASTPNSWEGKLEDFENILEKGEPWAVELFGEGQAGVNQEIMRGRWFHAKVKSTDMGTWRHRHAHNTVMLYHLWIYFYKARRLSLNVCLYVFESFEFVIIHSCYNRVCVNIHYSTWPSKYTYDSQNSSKFLSLSTCVAYKPISKGIFSLQTRSSSLLAHKKYFFLWEVARKYKINDWCIY